MFIQVRLLKGFPEPLLYRVPATWPQQPTVGTFVRVPIRNRVESAIVLSLWQHKPSNCTFAVKDALELETIPDDSHYLRFVHQLSAYYHIKPIHLLQRMRQFLSKKPLESFDTFSLRKNTQDERDKTFSHKAQLNSARPPFDTMNNIHHSGCTGLGLSPARRLVRHSLLATAGSLGDDGKDSSEHVTLTPAQQNVYDFLAPRISKPQYTPTLLHGVTGSGKTEVYKKLIEHAIAHNKTAVLLLPEITLALQFYHLLKAQLPNITIRAFHSAVGIKDKRALWQSLLEQQPQLIIGVHLPILLPLPNLGLIIVDEEHEVGYQEKKHPKLNTKESAIWRASLHKVPILLGSATPSVQSLHNVKKRGWHFFQLKQRFAGAFPHIKVVQLNNKKRRANFWVSAELEAALRDRLQRNEQSIVFLNRRGFSFFVQCKPCTFTFACTDCSVTLTLHNNNQLTCHYCGKHQQLPSACPACNAPENKFLKKGIGTQQVVTILQKLFPHARIGRADLDMTVKKKQLQETLAQFGSGELDILVGTQTITKGFNFPRVTLVGVLWADINLNFPIYNATETTLQQIIQVAGRAGRQSPESTVIVQTMTEHPVFNFVNEVDYLKFYETEIKKRALVGYPPCKRLVEIEIKCTDEQAIEREADLLVDQLLAHVSSSVQVLGPAKPPVHKIKKWYARKIYIKAANMSDINKLLDNIDTARFASNVYVTPNPLSC